jgi:hypothetical protein
MSNKATQEKDLGVRKVYLKEQVVKIPGNSANINYLIGDATAPKGKGTKLIIHSCNNASVWETKFQKTLSKRWFHPEEVYMGVEKGSLRLGNMQVIQVDETTYVANIIGQKGVKLDPANISGRLVSYDAIAAGLYNVRLFLNQAKTKDNLDMSIHIPRIGCDIEGAAKWECIEGLLKGELRGQNVFVYDLTKKDAEIYSSCNHDHDHK